MTGIVLTGALSGVVLHSLRRVNAVAVVTGAVLRDDASPNNQRPVGKARISAVSGAAAGEAVSDEAGFFRIRLPSPVELGQTIRLTVEHPDYEPAQISKVAGSEIQLVRLKPKSVPAETAAESAIVIANARVRYSVKSTTTATVGSVARAFAIRNAGNVPCGGQPPCSPDGRWKAAVESISLDAGENRQFVNARLSCIAGPCPFTRVESDQFSRGGRVISGAVLNWSDTVTYLLEAEVAHTSVSDLIRHSYPVIFGGSMNFTVPASAQGPCIEAEVGGTEMVFPLGRNLSLSWGQCKLEVGNDGSKRYRCELNPQYRFQ